MTTATEKAAPIPAEVLAPFRRMAECTEHTDVRDGEIVMRLQHPETKAWVVLTRADFRAIMQDRADRASQEERIRQDEPLPERLRKSYEKGAQDERNRLYEAGLKWPRDVCDFLEIEGAKVRARLRGDAS